MDKRMASRIKFFIGLIHSSLVRQQPGVQNGESSKCYTVSETGA